MYGQSGRYNEPLDATFRPPRGGLASKYRATRAPPPKQDSVAESDVSFGWIDDVDFGKSRKGNPSKPQRELGKSHHGELSRWNGLEATSRGRDYEFEGSSPNDNNVVRTKPPSGNTRGHAGMARKPPPGPPRVGHGESSDSPRLSREEPAQDKYSVRGDSWRTMALMNPREDGSGWGTMFGKMQIRWSGREQRKQAMSFASLAREEGMDGRGRTESNRSENSKASSLRPYRQRRKRICTFILASVLLLVLAVAVVIPTVIFTRKDDKSTDEALDSYVIYNYQAVSQDLEFQAEMNDPASEIYINTAQEFCSEMEYKVNTNFSGQYAGCVVTSLQSGSVIFIFSLIFDESPASPTATQINFVIVGTTNPNETVQIGSFTITAGSLVLNSTSVSTTADFTDVNCLAPTPVQNGNWSYDGSRFSNTAALTCNTGYEIQGEATITCTERYRWSSRPNCTQIVCVNYTLPADSTIEPSTTHGLTYNTNITVTCNPGFDMTGDGVVNCTENGNWSTGPTCNIKSCPNYTIPENSQISPTSPAKVYNSFFVVTCNKGYNISGENNVTCLANGTWSPQPTCNATVCVNYTVPRNSSIEPPIVSGHRYQTNITVTCNPGYEVDGDTIVTCMADGNWSASPSCNIKSCPDYTVPKNSQINPATPEITYGSSYIVMCDEGYELDGDTSVTCGANASWSPNPECQIIECPMFPDIENGNTNTDNISYSEFNSTVNVTCNVGYSLSSNDTVRCQSNKTWSVIPSCDLVVCEKLIQPANSKIHGDKMPTGQTYNTVLSISCDTGYNITGDAEVTCMASGSWSAIPRCEEIVCVDYMVPDNADIEPYTVSNQTFNTTLKVICKTGYEIIGGSAVTCEADGSWSKDPSCETVVCDDFVTPENGMIEEVLTTSSYGSNVTLTCMDGYIVDGPLVSTCQANKTWTEIGMCDPIPCETITLPEDMQTVDSITTISGKLFGEKVNITCVKNKHLTGEEQISCTQFGNWNITSKCVETDCDTDTFNQPDHSKILEANSTHLKLYCDEGYNITGEKIVICENSRWSASPNCTIVSCGELQDPANGNINSTGVTYLETANLECIQGYTPKNSDTFLCLATGNWNDTPECELIDCASPDLPANAENISVTGTKYGTRGANVTCKEGYETETPVNITCTETGNWTSVPPCNIVVCLEEPNIENGKLGVGNTNSDREYGDIVLIVCNEGYEVEANSSVKCEANGSWSGLKNCSLVDCGVFNEPLVANGTVVNRTGTTFDERVYFECDPGFLLVGEHYITCQQSGSWGNPPVCEEISCIDPNITYGKYRKYNGSVYEVECDDGFLLTGSNFIECQTDQSWNEIPTCKEVICANYTEELLNGDIVKITGTRYGDTVTFVCDTGFNLNGSQSILCDENGAWELKPVCEITDCGDAPVPVNGQLPADEPTTFNTTLYAECNTGYVLDGPDKTTCGVFGNWSVLGACVLQDCGNITVFGPYKELTYSNGTRYGSVATIECAENYTLRSEDSAVCTQDWNVTFFCTSTGDVSFDMSEYQFTVGDPGIIICHAEGAENWTNLFLSMSDSTIATINRTEDTYINTTRSASIRITENTMVSSNSATLEVEISPVACTDANMYFCAIGISLPNGDVDFNFGQARVDVIDTEAEVPILHVSNTTYNTTAVVTCESLLGMNSTDHPRGVLRLQAKLKSDTQFNMLTPELENTTDEECNQRGFLQYSFLVDDNWDDAEVKCVTHTDNGTLESETKTLAVTGVTCDELPTADFGSVNNETTDAGQSLGVVCDEGYINVGDTNFTCTTTGWSGNPNCTLIDCGPSVDFDNTVFDLTNETTTTYNSTVFGFCQDGHNVEQIYDNATYIVCGGDGNWNISFTCKPVECDNVTESTAGSIVFNNGTIFNSVLEIECDEGYSLVGNYSTAVCSSSGVWIRPGAENDDSFLPRCTIIGELSFNFESNVTAVESNLTATCTLSSTPDWSRIGIFRPTEEDSGGIAVVDRKSDNSTDDQTTPGVQILPNSYFNYDEAVLTIQITNVTCDNEGEYLCGALKDNSSDVSDDKSLTINSYITVTSEPEVPMLNISKTSLEPDDEVELSCEGYVGQTSTRDSKAQLDIQVKYSDKDEFETLTSGIAQEVNKIGCLIKHTKHTNLTINATYDRAVLRCVTDDGNSPLVSDNVTLTVKVTCDELPTVDFGSVNNETTEAGQTLEVVCDEGYTNIGDTNFTCTTTGWSGNPNCTLIDCGPSVDFDNTVFDLTNETTTTYNSIVFGLCQDGHNVEQIFDNATYIVCGGDGNWNISFACKPVECDNVTDPTAGSVVFNNGTIFNSVLEIKCDEGYSLVGNFSTAVCSAIGVWVRPGAENDESFLPTCTIIGELSFNFESNVTAVESNLTATCTLLSTPDWNRIGIFRPPEGEDSGGIAVVDRKSDNSTDDQTTPGVQILPNSYFNYDEAVLSIQITNVTCDNEGEYFCGALKGNSSDVSDDNSLTINSYITVTSEPEVPMLNISKTSLEPDDEVELSCEGYVGQTSTRDSKAQLNIQVKYSDKDEFETLTLDIAPEVNKTGCLIKHTKHTSLTINATYDGAVLRCVTDDGNGPLVSDNVTLTVTVTCDELPTVDFGSVNNETTEAGQTLGVVCDEGYINVGDTNFTCTTTGWSGDPNCTLIDCGPSVDFDNTVFDLTNETTTTYNSSVFGFCQDGHNVEQIFDNATYIVCGGDGNWNISFACKPVECDNVTEPTAGSIIFNNGTIFNSVLEIECDEDYSLVGNFSMAVCSAIGVWVRPGAENDESFLPTCTIIGELSFNFESNVTAVESNLTATCTLLSTPDWNRIGIFRPTEGEDSGVVAVVDRQSDNSTNKQTTPGVQILPNSYFNYDGAVLSIQITNVTCDNEGEYFCGALKGNSSDVSDDNSITINSYITVTSEPKVPMLTISKTSLEPDDEVELSCEGYVGQTSTRDSKAELDIQVKYSDKNEFETLTSDIAPEVNKTGCLIKHTKHTNLTINATYDGAVLRCVTDDENSPLVSDNVTLTVTVTCDELPTVDFGSVNNETTKAGQTLRVVCDEGYINVGDTNFTCTTTGWSGDPNCTLIDCGPSVDFDNTVFDLTNETTTTYNSSVFGFCQDGHNVEQIFDNATYIVCGGDGNWNISFACKPIECDNVTEPTAGSIIFNNGTIFNSVLEIECDEGSRLVGNYSTAVCSANGVWVRPGAENGESFLPTCTIIGELSFNFESNVTAVESNLTATCTLLSTPDWNRIGIFRPTEGEDSGVIAVVDRQSDNSTNKQTTPGVQILPNSYFNYDEAVLSIQITNVTCDNEGVYICGALKGNSSDVSDDNSITINSYITVTSEPDVPMLNISKTSLEPNDEVELSCEGYVGQTSTGDSKAQLDIQVKYSDKDEFETLTSDIAPEVNKTGCLIKHTKHTNLTINATYDGAVLRCVTDDGNSPLVSDNVTLTVTVTCDELPTVDFGSVNNETTEAGQTLGVVCDEGYINVGDTNFTCTTTGWSGNPNCTLIDCGPSVDFDNTVFDLTNETTTTYNSTVFGFCQDGHNVEQIFDNATYIVCGGDGNWNISFACKPIECDNVTEPTAGSIIFNNGTIFNSVLEIECDEGYRLVGNYSTAVCSANGVWVRPGDENDESFLPTCTIIGELSFNFESNVTAVESNLTATCTLLSTPDWNRIVIFRPTEGEDSGVIAVVDRQSDNNTNEETTPGVQILPNSYFSYDEAVLSIQITNVTCDNEGVYICGALKGNSSDVSDDNSLTVNSYITVTSEPDVPMLNISKTSLEPDDEVEISCEGYVGQTSTRDSKAQLDIQVKYSDKDEFETLTSDIAPEVNKTGCLIKHTKHTNLTINATYDGAVLRCVTDDGNSPLVSDNVTLTVTVTCGELPTVDYGSINNETTETGQTLGVVCDEGYVNFGDTNFTCTTTGWSGNPNCTLIDCGPSVDFDNTVFDLTNETTTTFNSTVFGFCQDGHNVEQIYDNATYIVCGGDGNWNISFRCKPVECDNITEPTAGSIVFNNGTILNSVLEIKCDEGYSLVGNYSTAVCSSSGVWIRPGAENDESFQPVCSIIGGLTFGFESNVTAVESNLTATCTLLNTPEWDRIGIFRPTEGEGIGGIAIVDRQSDNNTNEQTTPGVEILSNSYFHHDEAVLAIRITHVTCDNDGEYLCGALKGNISEISEDNSLTVDTFITVTSEPEVPMLNISKTSLEPDDEVELSCHGYVGQTSTRDSKAQLNIQIKFRGKNDFETITSAIAPEVKRMGCMIEHIKKINITVDTTHDGALLRCITDDGASTLFSDNVTLNVTGLSDVTFELQAVAQNVEFSVGMEDPSSSVFIDFQLDFCNGVKLQIDQSDLSEQYVDCSIVSLSKGSIIIVFTIEFGGDSPPSESAVISTFTETVNDTNTVQIGSYLITKSLVEVIGLTVTEGSVSVLFTSEEPVFNIGDASALNINIQGTTAWEMISIFKTRDGVQTSIGNITESFANVQFFSNHLSLSADSMSNENDTNIIIDFEPVGCDDDGVYTVEVRMDDGHSVEVDNEITVQYTPRVDLTLPVEMREDRWTLEITCEAVFHSSVNRTLSWLAKGEGDAEFMEFLPEDIVEKPVEFRRNMSLHTKYDCLWNVKEDFDLNTTSADIWNNTQLQCALDYGTSEQVLSEVGTILLVPRSVCANTEARRSVQNPLECTKRVQCNSMTGDWGYVFATGCEEGTCWVGPGNNDCENVSISTTTTTTTPVPGTPYISCSDKMRSEKEGTIALYSCELRNIDKVGTLNISQNDNTIYSDTDEASGISGVSNIGEGITVSVGEDYLNVSIEASCQNEGVYHIEINNGTYAELSLALIADPEAPEISVPSNIYLNQRTDVTCTGNVGRDKDGNNAADLSFEIRKGVSYCDFFTVEHANNNGVMIAIDMNTRTTDGDMFEEVDGTITRLNDDNNCTITQTASVSAYFERDFNKSAIRCVAKADDMLLSESALYNISLSEPAVSFVETDVSSFIGKPFSLECNVENVANLTKLELTKEGTSLAVISSDNAMSSEADVEIVDALLEEGSGKLKVNFSMSKCSDKGEYICEAITTLGDTFSTKTSVFIQNMESKSIAVVNSMCSNTCTTPYGHTGNGKPELPQLYPSLQIIEGVSPWADFPTQCYGEVGYPQGSISLESNRDDNGFLNIDGTDAVYIVDDEMCSSIGNITYYNTYTMDWDNTELKCVTRNSHVGDEDDDDGEFEISLTKTINVIPDSFCDDKEDGPVPHPYYCYGRLTCSGNGVPIPYHLCSGNNTQCFDESQGICVDCESVNMCDIGSTPSPTLPPGTPIVNCTKEVKDTKNSIVTVYCALTNINVTLATLNSSNVVITSSTNGNVVIDTATATLISSSESESVYVQDPVTAHIASSMIKIETNLTECDIAGKYTVRYNGNSVVEDDTNLIVTADVVPPVYSQKPNVFYTGQSVTIQCSGNIGGPKESTGTLSLIYKTSEPGDWLVDEAGTTEEIEDEETCGIMVTRTRQVDVTEDLDGYFYACETVTQDNQTYRSHVKEVSVQDPVLLFGEAEVTAAIGDPLDIVCTWDTTIINASATISRSAISSDSEEALLVYEFGGDVTSQRSGINGSFQPGGEGRPNNLSLTFEEIKCEDEAIYSCQLLVDDELVAEAKETIFVTSDYSTPTMTLPQELVLNQPTLYDDHLKCNGSVGYPSDNSLLKLEYYSEDGQSVMEFNMGTLVENKTETNDCVAEGVVSYRSITFDSGWNDTIFRCALYDGDDILDTSDNHTLLLFENYCDAENDGQYFQHPYDCHLYTWCYGSGSIAVGSCTPNCPNFPSNNTLVSCNACDESDCPTT